MTSRPVTASDVNDVVKEVLGGNTFGKDCASLRQCAQERDNAKILKPVGFFTLLLNLWLARRACT